ncbi:MAG TPA: SdrD B-like domain-containing protein, partial [Verrucomicrobiae bacterium]
MKFLPNNPIRFLSLAAAVVFCAAAHPVSAQECPLVFPPSPSNDLTAYITEFPFATNSKQPLVSYFLIDVTNLVNKTNYLNPPIPYGLYAAWCVDEGDDISPTQVKVPGSAFTGAIFSTCDPNLNSELPPGHPNTLVSSTNWQMVNYILNHQTFNGTNAFYWSVQAALNTLVGSGVGSVGSCEVVLNTPIPDGSMPDGACGYPTYNPVVVNGLLTAATNNYASWNPQCGDVYGAVYVTNPTNDQFLLLEVPVPCSPCIQISKQVACLQPNNGHGPFGSTAQGFAANCPASGPGNNPAFVYEITVTNCGTIALTNVIISDNLLGDLTTNFFASPTNVFEPGASATMYFSMSFPTNATNTVTVQGQALLADTVTNLGEVYTNGYPVADTATAVALVVPASISCGVNLYSALDLDGSTNDNNILLPSATLFSQPPSIDFQIQVCNTGSAALSAVTLNAPALTSLGFTLPASFNLAPGQCTNFDLGSAELTCSNQTFFSVATTGTVEPDASHCGVYDLAGNPLYVCSSCIGTVECSTNTTGNCVGGVASVSGTVLLNCDVNNTNLSGDAPMTGVTVVLYGAASNSLATNITDSKGDYSFTNLSAGSYFIAVQTATNFVETYPPGVTNGVASVTLVACQDFPGVNFGYADTTPPQIAVNVTPNQDFGCNPINLPTDTNIAAGVTAIVSCGTSNIVVTHTDTNINCLYARTYFVTVTDTYGNSASTNVTFTWTSNSTPPTIYGAPANADLGCNPTNLPSDSTVTNGMTASNLCSLAPLSVTNILVTNGCFVTNVFTVTANDSCGNSTSTNVVYTWTANNALPVIQGTPIGGDLGCNPTNLPTTNSVLNGMSASNACGIANLSVTPLVVSNGCYVTNIFM